jgi:hypothetical protein
MTFNKLNHIIIWFISVLGFETKYTKKKNKVVSHNGI